MPLRLTAVLSSVLLFAACAGDGREADSGPTVRDSAGIRIVEHVSSRAGGGWGIAAEPAAEIGLVDGEAAHQLNGVVGATRLRDGTIVIADGGSRELRFFDGAGRHIRSVAGEGGGPGELRRLRALGRITADTLIAADQLPGMLAWFRSDGSLIEETTTELFSRDAPLILSDASLLLPFYESATFGAEVELFAVGRREADADGLFRPQFRLVRVHRGGLEADTFGTFSAGELFRNEVGGELGFVRQRPYSRHTLYAAGSDHVVVAFNGDPAFRTYRLDGTLESIVRFPGSAVAVEPADLDAARDTLLPRVNPIRRAAFERWFAEVPVPQTKSMVGAVRIDALGDIWVLQPPAASAETERWHVFSEDGDALGSVDVPAHSLALEIGADYFLGLWRTDLDVEYIRLYPLTRPAT